MLKKHVESVRVSYTCPIRIKLVDFLLRAYCPQGLVRGYIKMTERKTLGDEANPCIHYSKVSAAVVLVYAATQTIVHDIRMTFTDVSLRVE